MQMSLVFASKKEKSIINPPPSLPPDMGYNQIMFLHTDPDRFHTLLKFVCTHRKLSDSIFRATSVKNVVFAVVLYAKAKS